MDLIRVPFRARWMFWIAWILLLLGSIPIILDYVEHVHSHSWAWYALAFPLCVVSSLSRTEYGSPRTALAFLLILVGIVLEIIAPAAGMLRLGRPGFLLAAAGILAADGRLDARRFVMMSLAIPIPHALLERIGNPLLFLNIEMLGYSLQAAGVPVLATAQGVERSTGLVFFEATDVGWTSAIFAFGLAWFLYERLGSSWARTLIGSGAAAAAGFAVHSLCTTIVFASVDPSGIVEARICRDVLSYSLIAVATGSYWVLRLRVNSSAR